MYLHVMLIISRLLGIVNVLPATGMSSRFDRDVLSSTRLHGDKDENEACSRAQS